MQKRTRSILDELDNLYIDNDRKHVIEGRACNIIASAINLIEQIESSYPPEKAENLTRKLLNAIRMKDPEKFTRTVRRSDED